MSAIDECLDQWVFTLFCIELKEYYTLLGVVPYTHSYEAISNARLNLERESGLHFDIKSMNESEVECLAKNIHG